MRLAWRKWLWLALGLGVACQILPGATPDQPLPTPILPVTSAPPAGVTPMPPPTRPPTPIPADTGWELLRPGLERRTINLFDALGFQENHLYVLRLDPTHYRFDLVYAPGEPQTLAAWQAQTGALIVLNGGFFTPEYVATGLTIVDGIAHGVSYQNCCGMLTLPEGFPQLRSLATHPYDPQEPLYEALQSFPVLVHPDDAGGRIEPGGQRARRTVIAQDQAGRIILLAASWSHFTLEELSRFLRQSDLEIEIALNLDGGASTGLLLATPAEGVPAFALLPLVIAVYPR